MSIFHFDHSYPKCTRLLLRLARDSWIARSNLGDFLGPDPNGEKACVPLRGAINLLRRFLLAARGEKLLKTRNNSAVLRLAEQSRLWIDVDAFEDLVAQASRAV